MKKILLIAIVMCIAIPAMAADISLVDNGDCTATIQLTSAAGEDVRGLGIVVEVDGGATIDAISGVSAELNVNMDAAFKAETDVPGSYAIGGGLTDAADPDGAGTIALPASKISICLGKVDQLGGQAAIIGNIDVATITLVDVTVSCNVTITADTTRGGIVGDAVVAGSIAGGVVLACDGECKGDGNASGIVDVSDLGDMIYLLNQNQVDLDGWPGSCATYGYCDYKVYAGAPDFNSAFDMNDSGIIDVGDLGDIIYLLNQNQVDLDGWPGSCATYGYCDYKYTCGE